MSRYFYLLLLLRKASRGSNPPSITYFSNVRLHRPSNLYISTHASTNNLSTKRYQLSNNSHKCIRSLRTGSRGKILLFCALHHYLPYFIAKVLLPSHEFGNLPNSWVFAWELTSLATKIAKNQYGTNLSSCAPGTKSQCGSDSGTPGLAGPPLSRTMHPRDARQNGHKYF